MPDSSEDAPVRDPEADKWKPASGPMDWEERTESVSANWTDGGEAQEGLAIRDTFNGEAYILSTLYSPDISGMR